MTTTPETPEPSEAGADTLTGANQLARLDRIPVWPHPPAALWAVGISYFFAFMDIADLGLSLPAITADLGMTDNEGAVALSMTLVGYVVGAPLNSLVSDLWGRRIALVIDTWLVAVSSLATAFAFNAAWLIGWRFVGGLGIGAIIAIATSYVGELAPAAVRGRSTAIATVPAFLGSAVSPFIALALVPNFDIGWRLNLAVPTLAGLAAFMIALKVPESPRWFISHQRFDDAERIIAAAEERARARTGADLPEPRAIPDERVARGFPIATVLKPGMLKWSALFFVIWFFFYIQNYGQALGATFFVDVGFTLSDSILFLGIGSLGTVAGALLSPWITDRFQRKNILIWSLLIMGAGNALIGFVPAPVTIVLGVMLIKMTTALFDPIGYTLTAEHFPTRARTAGVAVTNGVGHLGGAIAPLLVVAIYQVADIRGAYLTMALVLIVPIILLPFALATRKKALTELTR